MEVRSEPPSQAPTPGPIARLFQRLRRRVAAPAPAPDRRPEPLKVLYVPGFESPEEFADPFYRLLWYAHPIASEIERISVPASFNELPSDPLPPYLDPSITDLAPKLAGLFDLFPIDRLDLWRSRLEEADVILRWREDAEPEGEAGELVRRALPRKKTWRVDPHRARFEGSFHLYFSHDANPDREADLAECRRRFGVLRERLRGARKGYVFGTGPSLAQAFDFDFSDGVTLACNSMVKNRDLLRHLRPAALVFGDPIFHAGCSSYAADFRRDLLRAVEEHDLHLIVPFRDYKLYMGNLPPSVASRIVGVPHGPLDRPNLDLSRDLQVKAVGNILTLLLLPLASTLFEEVGILGCDGRLPEDDGYFWGHHKESQFTDRMGDIQRCHPAFFAIDYNDYYQEHCKSLETWLAAAEAKGVRVRNLTRSYIPALQKRSALAPRPPRAATLGEKRVALLDPDLKGVGHASGFALHTARLFSRLVGEVVVFDQEGIIAAAAGDRPANVRLVQLPPTLVRGQQEDLRGEPLALHFQSLWKFVEDHEVDHLILLYEGVRREMYATMPLIPYSIVVHVIWSLLKSADQPGTGVRRALGKARALFVIEDYLREPLRSLCPRVFRLPCRAFEPTEAPGEAAEPGDGILRLGTIGVINENRNVEFLLESLAGYSGPPIRYRLMGMPLGRSGQKAAALAERLKFPAEVDFGASFRYLTEPEYEEAFAGLDFIVLAYDAARELQACAALYSAARFDTMVIAPRVRPFASLAERYPAMFELYEPLDAGSLKSLLARMAESKQAGCGSWAAAGRADLARFRTDHYPDRIVERLREDVGGLI